MEGEVVKANGEWGVILAPAEKLKMNEGILPHLSKKLREKDISSLRFNFPFQMKKQNKADSPQILDLAYLEVWNYAISKFPDKKWCVGGIGIGGLTALRVASISYADFGIPPTICISYPMYPPNRPELVDTSALTALMGDGLFCQGSKSNRGTDDRLKNQTTMMARHAKVSRIGGANHLMEVEGKPANTVAFWIATDIGKFLRDLRY
ncbi:MAG: hypothetical protein HeimC2_25490 [Candidatus Heimdallarchaeota archaeon LC_2]|nr:MAG: hypothetical protein HeimC2_25490 [Candidatus Heimdallarchaeota archaeon LC_2]